LKGTDERSNSLFLNIHRPKEQIDILIFIYVFTAIGLHPAPVFGRFVQETARREKEYTKNTKKQNKQIENQNTKHKNKYK
jgi:hypothetical protein